MAYVLYGLDEDDVLAVLRAREHTLSEAISPWDGKGFDFDAIAKAINGVHDMLYDIQEIAKKKANAKLEEIRAAEVDE